MLYVIHVDALSEDNTTLFMIVLCAVAELQQYYTVYAVVATLYNLIVERCSASGTLFSTYALHCRVNLL